MKTLTILATLSILLFSATSFAQMHRQTTVIQETVVATNLNVPWDMEYGADGWIWFTELAGNIKRMNPTTYEVQQVFAIGDVALFGFSVGLHSMVLDPNFTTSPYLYVHYANTTTSSKIVRYEYDATNNTLLNPTIILGNILAGVSHNGSRMVIVDDKLFITLGDTYNAPALAQNLNSINGKVLRMNLDGSIPDDNPIPGSYIWTFGHRNPQGLCYANGIMYSSEHGTGANDEMNIIEVNRNYGWSTVEGVCNTTAEINFCTANNVKEPIWSWSPSIAPCGIDYYQNNAIPEWSNSLLVAVLKNKQLLRLQLSADGTQILGQTALITNTYGRLRDVLVIPDGRVFICTSNRDYTGTPITTDDRIIELKNPDALGVVNPTKSTVSLYPVPSSHILNIASAGNIDYTSIVDMAGKEVYAAPFSAAVDVSMLAAGVYSVLLFDREKVLVERIKILVK
ncbi:MAG: PQQ-dependent sugar dehydrogenase [Flavobacterium sp.]|nr:PQQ-dependent sugar dehydrogenase [Flavobacterium sp.]